MIACLKSFLIQLVIKYISTNFRLFWASLTGFFCNQYLLYLFLQTATFQCHRDNALCHKKSSVGPELDQPRESKWVFTWRYITIFFVFWKLLPRMYVGTRDWRRKMPWQLLLSSFDRHLTVRGLLLLLLWKESFSLVHLLPFSGWKRGERS